MTSPTQREALREMGFNPDDDESPARNRNRRRRESTEARTLTDESELDPAAIYAKFNAKNDAE